MSDELNKDLLKNLREVRCAVREYLSTGKIYRFNPDLGICSAVVRGEPSPEIRSGRLELLMDLMEQWPEFSGARMYPVPHPSESPEEAFDLAYTKDMWSLESAYGAARLRLLDWLIAKLEAEI